VATARNRGESEEYGASIKLTLELLQAPNGPGDGLMEAESIAQK